MAPRARNVGRKRKERSPIVEFPPEDAEELIDLTVSKIVETAEEGESSKHNSAAAASTTIEVYRPPGALQTLDDARCGLKKLVDFPAMGQCSRVVPGSVIEKYFLDQLGCDCLKNSWEEVKVWFDYTGGTKQNEGWNIDELRYFAKSRRDPALDKKCKLVMRQALKTIGQTSHIYCSTTVAFLAIG
ncbi:hypothetical protein R1sor_014656 [Riccia sorocarpa]|uniref:Uncharacterized protein n=1 Tax=Riccia sorocarpa TaxID=122646 RepID=A0ABD3HD03_9MARC